MIDQQLVGGASEDSTKTISNVASSISVILFVASVLYCILYKYYRRLTGPQVAPQPQA
jgi:hypothetical protein